MSKITVTGPGGTIWHEMHIIQKALESMGYDVEVEDSHPATMEDPIPTLEEWGDSTRDRMEKFYQEKGEEMSEEEKKSFDFTNKKILLKAEHHPWGG